jgi:acyl-CoA dehydrogenase
MREVRQASAAAGYFAALAPEEVGGGGLGFQALYRMWEAVFEFCGAEYWLGHQALSHWSRGPSHLYMAATPDLRAEILPDLFAMSEPDAGSDIWRMSTVARPVEGGWLLNGTKQWVTNSPYADWVLVFAVTDRALFQTKRGGLTGFVIPASSEGFRVDSVISMFGHAGGDEGILSFQEVFVPQRQVLGQPHDGLKLALSGVSMGRMYNSGRAVGMAKWALAKALAYAEDRVTFGRPLIENQAISFPLAESAMEVHAARLMGLDAARALDAGRPARALVSMSKAYSTETAVRALDRAVQVHGAMGFANETALSQAWQAMRRTCVADGSSEMMRVQIVKHLRSHGLAF